VSNTASPRPPAEDQDPRKKILAIDDEPDVLSFLQLLLEKQDFAGAAGEYDRTAYAYEPHEQASAAGYAAIFAHRENLKLVSEASRPAALRATVDSSQPQRPWNRMASGPNAESRPCTPR